MRNLLDPEVDRYRLADREVIRFYGNAGDHACGVFEVPLPKRKGRPGKAIARVIASRGRGWEHVSVSLRTRCPAWEEMEAVKRLFFRPDETAMQLHVPPAEHINAHPHCLHLWKPTDREIPRPPEWMLA